MIEYYQGFVPVSMTKKMVDLYNEYFSYPKIEASLISLANYTINTKNVKSGKEIINKIKKEQETFKYIFIDSGGYQSKVGRLNQDNYKSHLKAYFETLELLEDNMFMFSMDFPPCIVSGKSNAINAELSGKLTRETYKEISENYKHRKDKLIMIAHYALLPVFESWYKLFDEMQDNLREFDYWATGMLSKNYENPKIMAHYNVAKIFLKHFGIIPNKFHFLGTNVLPLIKPMYDDKSLSVRTFDTTIVAYTGNLSLLRKRIDGLYEQINISLKDANKYSIDRYIDTFSDYINPSLSTEIKKLFSWHSKKRMENMLVKFSIILQLHANLMKAKLLEQNLLYIPNSMLNYDKKQEEIYLLKDQISYNDLLHAVKFCSQVARK